MTRTEESYKNMSLIVKMMAKDDVTQKDILGAITFALCDISKSLAIITDKITEEENSEKGKWISEKNVIKNLDGTEYVCEGDPIICSNCGEKYTKYIHGYEWDITGEQPRFCPSCGKEMEMKE